MAITHFLCLANSKKYGERCIAGIELKPDTKGLFHPVRIEGKPKWIRPVCEQEHGQVPAEWVRDIKVGDIVQLDVVRSCPFAYQTENVLFNKKSLRVVRPARLSPEHLEQLAEKQSGYLFGNCHRWLSGEEVVVAGRSLILIKAAQPGAYFKTPYQTLPRLTFRFGENNYDLPMTDVNFFDRLQENPLVLNSHESVFLTISLGVCFEEKYYKLAAGVVMANDE